MHRNMNVGTHNIDTDDSFTPIIGSINVNHSHQSMIHIQKSTNNDTTRKKGFMYFSGIATVIMMGLIVVLLPLLLSQRGDDDHENQQSSIALRPSFTNHDNENNNNLQRRNRHRDLFFLRDSKFCRRTFNVPGESYQTVTVFSLFAWLTRILNPSDFDGSCGTVCPIICNHQPCFADYFSADDALCECFRDGSFQCNTNSFCDTGRDLCTCNVGYEGDPFAGCVDFDECRNTNICGPNGVCVNLPGSYQCDCDAGYKDTSAINPGSGCTDINECIEAPPCGPNSICNNTIGSFRCSCINGYTGNPPSTFCSDTDECATRAPCGINSLSCINTAGSYTCSCKSGYKDTSATNGGCVNINECREGGSNCIVSSENCVDTDGSFNCVCKAGYTGTAGNCIDVNECGTGSICGPNAACANTIGNYTCTCNPGFLGGQPPNCRKLNAWEKCPGPDSDCATGLECSITSRTESATSCCPTSTAYPCANDRCCRGAYTEGQTCPSKLDIDCRDGLRCAWRSVVDTTYVCCSRSFDNPLGTNRICL